MFKLKSLPNMAKKVSARKTIDNDEKSEMDPYLDVAWKCFCEVGVGFILELKSKLECNFEFLITDDDRNLNYEETFEYRYPNMKRDAIKELAETNRVIFICRNVRRGSVSPNGYKDDGITFIPDKNQDQLKEYLKEIDKFKADLIEYEYEGEITDEVEKTDFNKYFKAIRKAMKDNTNKIYFGTIVRYSY